MDTPPTEATRQRIESIDALRGFDMFLILGADNIAASLRQATDAKPVVLLAEQLEHVEWAGLHFYDIIFPLFIFLMGTSTVFSLTKIVDKLGKPAAYSRIIRRAAVLYVLGLIYYGGMSRDGGPEMFRYVGVLQRIAICYLFGALLFLNLRFRGLLITCAFLLIGYWAAMTFIPVPDHGAGVYEQGKNLAHYVDLRFLPGYKWEGDSDPEGLLSNLPAIATGLLGIFAGLIIQRNDLTHIKKVGFLAAAGILCLAIGHLWAIQFPIIKNLWTSSFTLVTGGWCYILLASFYLIIDMWKLRLWSRPFVWIGVNCLTVYLLNNFVGGFPTIIRRAIHPPLEAAIAPWGSLLVSLLALALMVIICWALYRKKIFIRV